MAKLLLTLPPQLSLTLSSCILQLTCDGLASRPGGEPIRQETGKPALMSQAWLEKEQTTHMRMHTHRLNTCRHTLLETHTCTYNKCTHTHTHTSIHIHIQPAFDQSKTAVS
ncbi:Hypothetical predicted protein [Octopus vulgaris]|uniref:Secreted protein n=1 Tax=Octopus vulgaris TaxID=6645 RepID=A0AA36B736_OCTVU|nr:Hypothetical predicted protein [Octopus vulgaris]